MVLLKMIFHKMDREKNESYLFRSFVHTTDNSLKKGLVVALKLLLYNTKLYTNISPPPFYCSP